MQTQTATRFTSPSTLPSSAPPHANTQQYLKTDWLKYKETLAQNTSHLSELHDIQEIYMASREITQAILTAMDHASPEHNKKKNSWWKFTYAIKSKIQERRHIRRLQKAQPSIENNRRYNAINKEVKNLFKSKKHDDWIKPANNLNSKNPSLAWNTIKKAAFSWYRPPNGLN